VLQAGITTAAGFNECTALTKDATLLLPMIKSKPQMH
jgi:hypothetical protein